MRASDLLRDLLAPGTAATPCDTPGPPSQMSQAVANAESEQPCGLSQKSQVSQGDAAPLAWPADLTADLRRVATAFEWTDADRRDFVAWARRSPEGLADAAEFLAAEVAKLLPPDLTDRRRVVLAMLAADPALRLAWTCADDGESDPVLLTLAIRGKGSCELAIPRAKFHGLALPFLIGELEQQRGDE